MAKAGNRYPLLIYEHIIKRWYPAIFALGIALLASWWFLPTLMPEKGEDLLDSLLFYGGIAFLVLGVFFVIIRKMAFVRPYPTHLKFVTPFMRLNISYKRIQRTTTSEMYVLFPPSTLSSWMREDMAKLFPKTAIVLELKSFPIPPTLLRLFLSKFFFKDKTPHLVLLVDKWLSFSSELESFRSGGGIPDTPEKKPRSSVLSSLSYDE